MDAKPIASAESLGTLIRERRRALKMPQELLSSISGVPQSSLSQIERGQVSATLETYLKLLAALGIDLQAVVRS